MLDRDDRSEAASMLRAYAERTFKADRESNVESAHARELADKLEAEPEPNYDEALDVAAKILHTFGCVPSCQREDTASWIENARILLGEVVPLLPVARERDEAREALERARAEHLAALADRTEQRDAAEHGLVEAREALREMEDALAAELATDNLPPSDDSAATVDAAITRTNAARENARALLEGVERTRTLVPNAVLSRLASIVVSDAPPEAGDELLATALCAAARGEHVEWPSTDRLDALAERLAAKLEPGVGDVRALVEREGGLLDHTTRARLVELIEARRA